MVKQSLLRRKPKSDVAKKFVGVLKYDKKGRPSNLIVPGSGGKQYQVLLRRFSGIIQCECHVDTSRGLLACPGNGPRRSNPTICYHSRAAVDFSANEAGYKTAWCQSAEDAEKVKNLHKGRVVKVLSRQSKAQAWIVLWRAR